MCLTFLPNKTVHINLKNLIILLYFSCLKLVCSDKFVILQGAQLKKLNPYKLKLLK